MDNIIVSIVGFVIGAGLVAYLSWRILRERARELALAVAAERTNGELAVVLRAELAGRDRALAERDDVVRKMSTDASELEQRIELLRSELGAAREQNATSVQRIETLAKYEARARDMQEELVTQRERVAELQGENAGLRAQNEIERKNAEERIRDAQKSDAQVDERFRGIAAEVLERSAGKLGAINEEKIGAVLKPLGAQIVELKQAVSTTHTEDVADRARLQTSLKTMVETTHRIGTGADNLAKALKGNSQVRGSWGEAVLDTVLEQCGLREGHEYTRQAPLVGDDNQRLRPDVIVNLPGGRRVIVDSKVSLMAYEEYANASDEASVTDALARHVGAVRTHVKQLAEKEYWRATGGESVDFVVMFVPIEPALTAALRADGNLIDHAFERRVVLASPTTLFATLRTIEHTWRVERQNANTREIVRVAGQLYDKFRGLAEDMEAVGAALDKARDIHGSAVNKVSTGRGNLVGTVQRLTKLGVRATKPLPAQLTAAAEEDFATEETSVLDSERVLMSLSAGDA